ncbi:MAG TPA: cyclic nucleotide-binding domain-containing protein [Candidatus Acidoferrum sp.]|jgi:CRP/FNR family cyclic AMP-dependent transcriptional regulator|nr:cyclic nucleotide-binding domain-containing protein [Candidatus Acidoferrum sp.]
MADLSMFAGSAEIRKYPAGHKLFSAGDAGDVMYVVLSGEVEIVINDKIVETVRSGGIFGEMALIDRRERSASARMKTTAEVAAINQEQFISLLATHPFFSIEVMHSMTERLRLLNQALF